MRIVSSRHNPLVRAYRDAARTAGDASHPVLLDGVHLVRDALDAGLAFDSVAVTHRALGESAETTTLVRDLQSRGIDVASVSEPVMSALSPVRAPSGITALARVRA